MTIAEIRARIVGQIETVFAIERVRAQQLLTERGANKAELASFMEWLAGDQVRRLPSIVAELARPWSVTVTVH
jgi:hypothetical protein